ARLASLAPASPFALNLCLATNSAIEPCDPIGYNNLQNLAFGFTTWKSLFTDRQLYVIARLAQGVREAHAEMLVRGVDAEYSRALATYLALLVDKIADYNSSFNS